jgi:hypothetical protein
MVLTLKNRLKLLAYIGAASVLAVSMIDGGPRIALSVKRLSALEAALFVAIAIFDRFLWRWWHVPTFLKSGPVLRGTWRGTVRPTDGADTEFEAYLSVRQTFSGIAFRLMTAEMTSESSTAVLSTRPEGLTVGEYVYESTPRESVRQRSPIHFGAARIATVGNRPRLIEGSYFTSRRTTGELQFDEYRRAVANTYADAKAFFASGEDGVGPRPAL